VRIGFLAKRFVQVAALAFITLTLVYVLRGRHAIDAAVEAAFWSLISAAIFVGSAIYYRKTKRDCKLCVEDGSESLHDDRASR
jgi:hypothetical protein